MELDCPTNAPAAPTFTLYDVFGSQLEIISDSQELFKGTSFFPSFGLGNIFLSVIYDCFSLRAPSLQTYEISWSWWMAG